MIRKILFIIFILLPTLSFGAEVHQDFQAIFEAKVLNIQKEAYQRLEGTKTDIFVQDLEVLITSGIKKDQKVFLQNDFQKVKVGDKIFINYLKTIDDREIYTFKDIDRRSALLFTLLVFVFLVIVLGGFGGIRSLLSLFLSFLAIFFVLVPLLLSGYSAVLVSIFVGVLILSSAIYITHGFNLKSNIALLGTFISVFITSLFARFIISKTSLSGFFSDESVYLNLNTGGTLNFEGLLLGGVIIGILGVLDDISVTQVAVVFELKSLSYSISSYDLYKRAIRVGKEHIGALVNTLVLAYSGVSLYLILLFSKSNEPFSYIINSEIFATEIVRTIIGSIGLIISVPITTFLAVYFVNKLKIDLSKYKDHGHIH